VNVRARSVEFPSDSVGVYEWDAAEVARIAVAAVGVSPHLGELDLVGFILFSPATHEGFIAALG
jgi:O-acetyl-ADP-ribose deacetylase (regulator of RNase III)